MKKSEQRQLVDRLAQIRFEKKQLEDEESDIRAALLSLDKQVIDGDSFIAVVKETVSNRLDTKVVKLEMGDAWYKRHSTESRATRIDITAKAA